MHGALKRIHLLDFTSLLELCGRGEQTLEEHVMVVQWVSFSESFGNYDFLSICGRSSMPLHAKFWEGWDYQSYEEILDTEFVPINAQYAPTHRMTAGTPQRWRRFRR